MSILKVARMGHPILRKVAKAVDVKEITTPAFQQFLLDMIDTMKEYDGVGLAAPQVHRSVRVSVVELPESEGQSKKQAGLHIFINPEIEYLTEETNSYWEGCLSVPGLRGLVARPNKIKVKYLDGKAGKKEMVVDGFLATVLQHEFDHLDGKLYIDRLVDTSKLVFDQEFEKYWLPSAEDSEIVD